MEMRIDDPLILQVALHMVIFFIIRFIRIISYYRDYRDGPSLKNTQMQAIKVNH